MSALPTLADELATMAPNTPAPDASFDADLEEFGPRLSIKDARQLRALRAFVRLGKVGEACKAAGVTYGTWYRWRNEDPEFERASEYAKEILANELEEVGMQRAKEGSDSLLMFFLRALRPKYRDKQTIEVVSPDVQSRLSRQADAIMEVCRATIADPDLRAAVATSIANRLREIWT
ncbi:MAG TPA: hypothetical protein VHZ95_16550 [Polyangiales bacterium]|jgi:hypothetical protein|nr:hypothetical protein [Polyangiales bacterium]